MAFSTHEFKLDLTPGASRPVLYASQGDIGRPFMARCYWNGATWTATGNTANIRGRKPDETVFDYTATVDGSTVTFETTEQMTIISGPVECELVFSQGGDVIASANFVLMVEESPYDPDAPSQSVIPGIADLIEETIGGDVRDEVQAELEAHPEWTTTVQDGAVTKAKINTAFLPEIENAYVTPEMFGAKGDGVADDTRAWQEAVDVGLTVIAQSLIYKCGQVDITKNINVDCNNAKFVCTSEYLFKPSGAVVATLTGQGDYTANQTDFKITDTIYSNYGGYGMIQGDNNWNTFRTYYYGGMVGNFKNGYFYDRIPVDATNATVLIINPIVCSIANISECEFTSTHDGKIIYCSYGVNCRFENINVTNECYHIVAFYRCYKCTGSNIYAPLPMYTGALENIYPTVCLDSSFCTIENSYIYNPFWHAWTTGGKYVCYNNKVLNCEMFSDRQCAIEDHENGIDTYVGNTTTNGINLAQGGTIENIIMEPRNDTSKNCIINFAGSTVKTLARYLARNVVFRKTQNDASFGFTFKCYPQTSGNTAYYNKVDLQNIYNETVVSGDNLAKIEMPYSDNDKLSSCVLGTFRIDGTNFRCNLQQGNATMYDNTYSKIVISNCRDIMNIESAGKYVFYNPVATADMYIENSVIGWTSTVTYKNVTFNNVEFNTAPTVKATGIVKGSNISFKTTLSASTRWIDTNVINLSNVTEYTGGTPPTAYSKIWRTSSNANMYGEKLNADGTTTTVTLVTV